MFRCHYSYIYTLYYDCPFVFDATCTCTVVAETCRDGELRLDNVQRNYIGEGVLEICRGLNTSGGQEGGIWRKVCLLELNYVTPSPIQILPAQVACRHLQSQNNWDFNISGKFIHN